MLAPSLTTPGRAVPGPRSVARSRHEREAHRRLQPLRGDLRPRADGRGTRGGQRPGQCRRSPLARTHLPQGRRHRRRVRRPRPVAATGPPGRGDGGGGWQEIGWDEAFDLVADNLARVINEQGDDALGIYLGNPNAHSLGSMTHGTAMFKSFRTKNRYSATSVDQLPHQLVAHLMFGHQLFLPIPDIDRTSWFLVIGANPMASNGSLMTVPDFPNRVRDLRARDGRMIVLDPRHTETAKVADEHHFVRPGSDAFVLLAMLHVLTAEAEDVPEVASYVDGLATVVELVADFTPERAEAMSGLKAEEIRRLAHELRAADAGVVYSRVGVSAGPWGSVCQWAVNCLNVISGNLDRVGGAMFTTPAIDAVGTGLIGRGHHDAWRSRVRGLPETAGELPVSVLREEIETPGDGPGPRGADGRRQPGAVDAGRRPPRRGARGPGLHGRRRHLRQRDHPSRRRDPAADHRAGARPLRPGLPPARRARHRALHPGGLREGQGPAPRLGDLPRDHPAHHVTTPPQGTAAQAAGPARAAHREPDLPDRPAAAARPQRGDAEEAASATRPASTSARCAAASCPSGCRRRTSGSTSRPPSSWTTYADSLRQRRRPRESSC